MDGVRYRAGRELRSTWRSLVVSVLLIGLAAGVVLASAAGARRNGSAYARMLERTDAGELVISTDDAGNARVAAIDGVAEVAPFRAVQLYPVDLIDRPDVIVAPSTVSEGAFGYEVEQVNLRSGRMPDPREPFEAVATRAMAERLDLHPGDRVEVVAASGEDDQPMLLDGRERNELTIVGIGAMASDIVPVTYLDDAARFFLTPALLELVAPADRYSDGAVVELAPGVRPTDVLAEVQDAVGPDGFVDDRADDVRFVEQALRPQAAALWVFAALSGAAAALAVAQVLGRQVQHSAVDDSTLRSLGMRRRERVLLATFRGAVLGGAAAVVAVLVAVGVSLLFPRGPARWAEPDPGVDVDGPVLLVGALVVALLVTSAMASAAFAVATRGRRLDRTSAVASAIRSLLPGPAPAIGIDFAVHPARGERAAGWSAVFGAAAATAALLLAVTFGSGLDRLLGSPDRYGQDWTFMVDTQFGVAPVGRMVAELGNDPAVAAIAGGQYGDIIVNGVTVPAVGFTDLSGTTFPTVVEGRTPARDDELTMGASTLRSLGVGVGDDVVVDTGAGEQTMSVVGRVVLPRLSHGSFTALGLGNGAVLRASSYPQMDIEELFGSDLEDDVIADMSVDRVPYPFATVRMADGASAVDTERVRTLLSQAQAFLRTEQQPAAVANYGRVRGTSTVLALVLAALAAASLAHALVSSVRHRTRDLAVLKVLGFSRHGVRRVVGFQASALAVLALLAGVPTGVVGGRVAWRWFADDLGVVPDPVVPVGIVALLVPATLVLANVIGVVPAWWAARARAATHLRAE